MSAVTNQGGLGRSKKLDFRGTLITEKTAKATLHPVWNELHKPTDVATTGYRTMIEGNQSVNCGNKARSPIPTI